MSYQLDDIRESSERVVESMALAPSLDQAWQTVIEMGWLLASLPEEKGGLDLGLEGTLFIQRLLASKLVGAPYLAVSAALVALRQVQVCDDLVDCVVAGQQWAVAPLADTNLSVKEHAAGGFVIDGDINGVCLSGGDEQLLCWSNDLQHLLLVSLNKRGVSIASQPYWDETRQFSSVYFRQCVIDKAEVLLKGEQAQSIIDQVRCVVDAGIAVDSLGAAKTLMEDTLAYLGDRKQFGRPIALFQALKHRCADLWANFSAAEAFITSQGEQLMRDSSAAQAALFLSNSAFVDIAEESLQMHGGIAMAVEHPCHLFLKRAQLNQHLGRSGVDYQRDIFPLDKSL